MKLTCFVDSDWGGDTIDRRSVSGYVYKVFGNIVTQTIKKQHCVTLSTCEAELVALTGAVCNGLWLKKLLNDFNINVESITIFEDKQGTISIIKNPGNNKRVKHIDLKYKFICENVQSKVFNLVYIDTNCQEADILTKGLHNVSFVKFKYLLGLRDFSEGGC